MTERLSLFYFTCLIEIAVCIERKPRSPDLKGSSVQTVEDAQGGQF